MLDYYTLQETLKMLTESSNDKYTYTARDIATLCRQSILTPVFAYSNDCMEILEYYDENKPLPSKNGGETEYDTSRAPEPMTTHFHDGYLTDKRLLSLLDESQNKLELFSVMTYESDGSGCEIALVTNGGYTITRESLLFPSEQVQNYIASKQTTEQKTPEQQRVIDELKSQIAYLQKKLEALNDTPANSVAHSNTDIQNVKQAAIRQFNKSLATVLIELDYQDKLRKSDIAKYIMPYMKKLAFILADEDEKKAANLTVSYDTLYDTHLQGMGFKAGRQSNQEKNKENIDLLFKKELPVTE